MDQLTRQFWVTREQVKANKYDLSASRYRQVEQDEAYYEKPQVTLERLLELERVMAEEVRELERLLGRNSLLSQKLRKSLWGRALHHLPTIRREKDYHSFKAKRTLGICTPQ